jgi:soluble P-type ATPase
VVEEVKEEVKDLLNLPVGRDAYVAGLEAELVFYGHDKERKAAITAELDRVRGGKAVAPKKETR